MNDYSATACELWWECARFGGGDLYDAAREWADACEDVIHTSKTIDIWASEGDHPDLRDICEAPDIARLLAVNAYLHVVDALHEALSDYPSDPADTLADRAEDVVSGWLAVAGDTWTWDEETVGAVDWGHMTEGLPPYDHGARRAVVLEALRAAWSVR